MTQRIAVSVVTLALLGLPAAAQAQTTWFSSSWTSGNFPQGNFDNYDDTHEDEYYTLTRVPGGCPDGNDSVSVQFIEVGTHEQFQYGWGVDPAGFAAAVTAGSTFYLKYRIKPNAVVDMTGNAPETGFYMKFIIFGANVDGQRLITDLRDNGSTPTATTVMSQLNVGGGNRASLTLGSWNHIVQGYTLATNASSNDGNTRVWRATSGTLTEGSPTATNSSLDIEVNAGRAGFGLGRFTQGTLAVGASFGYELCNVVLTNTFDANWPTPGGGGGGGSGPARFRIRAAFEDATLPVAMVAALFVVGGRRRQRGR